MLDGENGPVGVLHQISAALTVLWPPVPQYATAVDYGDLYDYYDGQTNTDTTSEFTETQVTEVTSRACPVMSGCHVIHVLHAFMSSVHVLLVSPRLHLSVFSFSWAKPVGYLTVSHVPSSGPDVFVFDVVFFVPSVPVTVLQRVKRSVSKTAKRTRKSIKSKAKPYKYQASKKTAAKTLAAKKKRDGYQPTAVVKKPILLVKMKDTV